MRVIVTDTGPVRHLSEAGAQALLPAAGQVMCPPVVAAEIRRHLAATAEAPPAGEPPIDVLPLWLSVSSLSPEAALRATEWVSAGVLHAGEAEALALAHGNGADWLLTDDAAARLVGTSLGLEVHGSLGVLLWAAAAGHLHRPDAEDKLAKLAASSLWVSASVLQEAREALSLLFG